MRLGNGCPRIGRRRRKLTDPCLGRMLSIEICVSAARKHYEDSTEETMEEILYVGSFQAQHNMRLYGSVIIEPYDWKDDAKRRLHNTHLDA